MNILFYVDHSVATGFGGQERATGSVASGLVAKGMQCYYVYRRNYENDNCSGRDIVFLDNRFVPESENTETELLNLVEEWRIHVVVVQGVFVRMEMWRQIVNKANQPCHLVFAHHFCPKSELQYMNKDYYLKILLGEKRKISERYWAIKQILFGNKNWENDVRQQYRDAYYNADKVVLLSNSFVQEWQDFVGIDDSKKKKICVIPNMLSYNTDELIDIRNKEKIVLIVSRLEEKSKRISIALWIWRLIEKVSSLKDWQLVIVGDGPDRKRYEEFAQKYLKRYSFEGYKEPEEYYRRASVFMMTSAFEGWGLTLTEAQQFGCVPIVLNTFSSAKDIIDNGKNGYLVKNHLLYFNRLKRLMSNVSIRENMAETAIISSQKFCKENVTLRWLNLFNSICICY